MNRRWIPPFGTRRRNRIHAEAVRYLETQWLPLSLRTNESMRRAFIYGYTAAKGWNK